MKELPILFSGPMVRAILEGRKTQTRRVVASHNSTIGEGGNWQNFCWDGSEVYTDRCTNPKHKSEYHKAPLPWVDHGFPDPVTKECNYQYLHVPYLWHEHSTIFRVRSRIAPGDHLWVKEKTLCWQGGAGGLSNFVYADDPEVPLLLKDNPFLMEARGRQLIDEGETSTGYWQWRNGRFMFKWQARLWLKVTEVRAQRVQDITEADAVAEGVGFWGCDTVQHFSDLWDSINGNIHPWSNNDWVWAYTFKRIEKP